MNKIKTIFQLNKIVNSLKKKRKTVGLITGVFDVLHFEHVEFLSFAKKRADFLIIGIESDENVKLFKGKGRPLFDFKKRVSVLSAMECVDFIFRVPKIKKDILTHPYYPEFYKKIVENVGPDFLISNISSDRFWKEKKQRAKKLNIKFIVYDKKPTISSSQIVSTLLKLG